MSNSTKIKYTSIGEKLYTVKEISFMKMSLVVVPCDLNKEDIPKDEFFPIEELKVTFYIRIEN